MIDELAVSKGVSLVYAGIIYLAVSYGINKFYVSQSVTSNDRWSPG